MQNEILKPVLDTDEVAVPRYDIVGPNGSVIQQNVELRLKNEVVQEGTPYDEESILPASLREQLELPKSATPAEAFLMMLKVSGGAVARNRPPAADDAQSAGKIWIVPAMVFNNQMPNALNQQASTWVCTAATVAASGKAATFTGDGTADTLSAEASMLTEAASTDTFYVSATATVLDDANSVTVELVCSDSVIASEVWNVPTGGDVLRLIARAPAGAVGTPILRVSSRYNTASAQSGKRITLGDITVWNMTADMCQAAPELEFTTDEADAYITQFGMFQTREYEYSQLWWLCEGVRDSQYVWTRPMSRVDVLETQHLQQADQLDRTQKDLMTLWLKDYYLNGAAWSPQVLGAKAMLFDGLLDASYLKSYDCKFATQLLTMPNAAGTNGMWLSGVTSSVGKMQTNANATVSGSKCSFKGGGDGNYKLAGMRIVVPAGQTITGVSFSGVSGGYSRTRFRYFYTSTDASSFTLVDSGSKYLDSQTGGGWSYSKTLGAGIRAVEFWVDMANQSGSGQFDSSFTASLTYGSAPAWSASSIDFTLPQAYKRGKLFLSCTNRAELQVAAHLGSSAASMVQVSNRADPLFSGFTEYEFSFETPTAQNTFALKLNTPAGISNNVTVKRYGAYFTE